MDAEGGCYCGAVRYRVSGEVLNKAMCFCRECQHVAAGGPNTVMVVAEADFAYTRGQPRTFARSDLPAPSRREFCETCGTHLVTRSPGSPGMAIVKVGTLDDPAAYGMPTIAVFTGERQAYHCIPEGVRQFEKIPQRG